MKKLCVYLLIIILTLTACSDKTDKTPNTVTPVVTPKVTDTITSPPPQNTTPSPSPSPEDEADATASATFDTAAFVEDSLKALKASDIAASHIQIAPEYPKLAAEAFKRLEWSIQKIDSAGANAFDAVCEITTVNTVDAVNQYVLESYRMVSENTALPDGERLTDAQINDKLEDMFAIAIRATDTLTTATVTLRVEEQNGGWIIVPDESAAAALTGNLAEAVKQADFPSAN